MGLGWGYGFGMVVSFVLVPCVLGFHGGGGGGQGVILADFSLNAYPISGEQTLLQNTYLLYRLQNKFTS